MRSEAGSRTTEHKANSDSWLLCVTDSDDTDDSTKNKELPVTPMIISLECVTEFMKDSKLTFVPRCRMFLRVAAPRTHRQHQHQHHVTFVPLLLSQPFGQLLHSLMAELEGVYSARHSILTRILTQPACNEVEHAGSRTTDLSRARVAVTWAGGCLATPLLTEP